MEINRLIQTISYCIDADDHTAERCRSCEFYEKDDCMSYLLQNARALLASSTWMYDPKYDPEAQVLQIGDEVVTVADGLKFFITNFEDESIEGWIEGIDEHGETHYSLRRNVLKTGRKIKHMKLELEDGKEIVVF